MGVLSKHFEFAVSVCIKIYFYTVDNAANRVYTIYRKKPPIFKKRSIRMNWEEIYSGIRSFAGRAATKINQTADMAALQVKLSMAERKLEEAYAALGKASFGHFVEDKENYAEISARITEVKNAMLEIRSIKQQIEDLKERVAQAEAAAKTFNESVAGVAAEAAAEHAQAVKAAEAAKADAEVRAAAVRARQEAEEPLEVFDFDEEDLVGGISNADGAVEIDLEVED